MGHGIVIENAPVDVAFVAWVVASVVDQMIAD